MKIHELKIAGFKSIGEITLVAPNPFSVFVGPNGAGKSNIFEALELMDMSTIMRPTEALRFFGEIDDVFNQAIEDNQEMSCEMFIDVSSARHNTLTARARTTFCKR